MRYGLLQASFIPPAGQRHLRDFKRYRPQLGQERSREVNRVQGVLERANSKLAVVASDIVEMLFEPKCAEAVIPSLIDPKAYHRTRILKSAR